MARKQTEARSIPSSEGSAAPLRRRRVTRPKGEVAPAEAPISTVGESADATVATAAATQDVSTGLPANGETVFTLSEREEIEHVAYSYWEARGCQGGSPEEDWQRAEAEVRRRRMAS